MPNELKWSLAHLRKEIAINVNGDKAEITVFGTDQDKFRLLEIGDKRFELQVENNRGFGACVMPRDQNHKLVVDNVKAGDTLYVSTASGTQVLTI